MKFLVSVHHPNGYDSSTEDDKMHQEIQALNDEMVDAGVWFFAGGLTPSIKAKTIQKLPNGEVTVTDGPHLKTNEYIGGFWILETSDLADAVEWGRKATVACRVPVEVRQFLEMEDSP